MKFQVTQKMIDEGITMHCYRCPVALAIKQKFPDRAISVDGESAVIGFEEYDLPMKAINFIHMFDAEKRDLIHPFSFSLDDK